MMKRAEIKTFFAILFIAASLIPLRLAAQESRSPVAPRREVVEAVVREAYEKFRNDTGGKNADYIPYLAQVDSKLFGGRYSYNRQPSAHIRGCELFLLHPVDLKSIHPCTGNGRVGPR